MAKRKRTSQDHRNPAPPVVTHVEGERLVMTKGTRFAYFMVDFPDGNKTAVADHRISRPEVVRDPLAPTEDDN